MIVTSLRRSGSSMLMYALKEAGLDIVGNKFNGGGEQSLKGNPNGYWEIPKICTETGLQHEIDGVIKIMFEALSFSKPEHIDKAILIFREPRKMLASMFKHNQIDYPDIFIYKQAVDIIDALIWLKLTGIRFRTVIYEDILANPKKEFKRMFKFIGKGDYKKAADVVDLKLNRSNKFDLKNKYIDILEDIYNKLKNNEIDTVISMHPQVMAEAKMLMDNFDKTKC